jgi:hypothetical protein
MRGFFGFGLASLLVPAFAACGTDKFSGSEAGGPDAATDSPSTAAPGCADGAREAFLDGARFPRIAACSGAFSVPGTQTSASMMPQCNRSAGNTGANPLGNGCSIEDLCAEGWHVCHGTIDVTMSLPAGTTSCATVDQTMPGFWLTRQTTNNNFQCINFAGSLNNVVGCASIGMADVTCAPLTTTFRFTDCVPPWQCDAMQPDREAGTITKVGPQGGGVMCCKS